MDFSLSDDQRLLQESVTRFLEREYDFAKRQRILAQGGFDPAMWRVMAEMGLFGAHLPEELGGFGGGIETLVIMEAFGRHLVLEPMVQCAVIGGAILAGDKAGSQRDQRIEKLIEGTLRPCLASMEGGMRTPYARDGMETIASKTGAGWTLSGAKAFVDHGAAANLFLVTARTKSSAGLSIFAAPSDARGLEIRTYRTMDGRTAAELKLNDVALGAECLIGEEGRGGALMDYALDRGMAAVCAEAVGAMDYLMAATTAYTRGREQYGAPLATYQALQHRMADMLAEIETARSMAYLAAFSIDADEGSRVADVSAARVQIGRSARFVGQQAVQLHGGMGMSEDVDVAHHFKRLTLITQLFGEESVHLRRFRAATA